MKILWRNSSNTTIRSQPSCGYTDKVDYQAPRKKKQTYVPYNSVAQNDVRIDTQTKCIGINKDYLDSGDAVYVCSVCKTRVWKGEAIRGNKDLRKTSYSICCYNGKVELPNLIHPPQLLLDLYSGVTEKSQNFIKNIRRYNIMFAFTSMDDKTDHVINSGGGPYVYRMHGQNYHIAGSLLPEEGELPKFCQLYIYDTDHEVDNRFNTYDSKKKNSTSHNSMGNHFSPEFLTIHELMGLLDFINPLVKQFRMERDRFGSNPTERIMLKLIGTIEKDGRQYNLPTTSEVAALITHLKQYQAHMNLEWCNQLGSIKYLFKYINKGLDRITASFYDAKNNKKQHKENNDRDEIVEYYNCRYISACEACWRLFRYYIHYRTPHVERLSFHLQDKQLVVFKPSQRVTNVVSKPTIAASQFLAWMECNSYDEKARELSYVEFPTQYVWNKSDKVWTRRKTKTKSLGRINHVSPKSLFVMLITPDSLSRPHHVFKETYNCLSDDVVHVREQEIGVKGLKLKPEAIYHLTLSYIEKSLLSCGVSFKQIPNMPLLDHKYIQDSYNMLIQYELNYDPSSLESEHQHLHSKLKVEQKNVYDIVMNAVNNKKGRWILEFLIRQHSLDDRLLNVLIPVLPLPNNDPSITKSLLLRKLESDIKKGTISERTLEFLEQIEELDHREGNTEVSEAMKAAYCAVAVHCTVKLIEGSGDDDTYRYFCAVSRIWRGRAEKMEKFDVANGVGLVSDDLLGWMDYLEAGVWVPNYFEKVLVKYKGLDVVDAVCCYVKEAKEKMGPTFLELVAETLGDDMPRKVLDLCKEEEHHDQIKEVAADGASNDDQCVNANLNREDKGAHNRVGVDDPSPSCDHGEALHANGDDQKEPKVSLIEQNSTSHVFEWSDSIDSSNKDSPKKRPIAPLKYKNKKLPQTRKKMRWSITEEDTLRTGVLKYGKGNWKLMLNIYRDIFVDRTEAHGFRLI
ncbi:unnamed protein product [Lactuca virosa]|uniref:Myb-like domain-containing protein n=1 Tax=Lactuca virosa TaxID=75947 RepID=A0AAU9NCB6_9ASTR|nr:unnamed protein product [Lactuca virosa]